MVKIRVVGTLSIVLSLLLSACSQGSSYSSGSDSSVSECQSLADQYWSEYQAYKDARAANNNVEDDAVASNTIDILSNGFKIRTAAADMGQAVVHAYVAFAETPFKYSNAR